MQTIWQWDFETGYRLETSWIIRLIHRQEELARMAIQTSPHQQLKRCHTPKFNHHMWTQRWWHVLLGLGFGNLLNYLDRYEVTMQMENPIPSFVALVRLTINALSYKQLCTSYKQLRHTSDKIFHLMTKKLPAYGVKSTKDREISSIFRS